MSSTETTPANANSLRGSEFRRLLGLRKTWLWIGGFVVVLGVATGRTAPIFGVVFAAITLLVGLGVVFWIADRNAGNRFWQTYAETRGLELGGKTQLPRATPFLKQGSDRYATRTLSGQIAPGVVVTLGLFT